MKKKVVKQVYMATVKILGRTYKAKGKTIYDAISSLETPNVKSMGILTVSKGKNSRERVLSHIQSRKLFNTRGLTREVMLNNISLMFDGV